MMISNPLPLHPGKVLSEIYMAEMGLIPDPSGKTLWVPDRQDQRDREWQARYFTCFCHALESALGTSAEMWVRMQAEYDLWEARLKVA